MAEDRQRRFFMLARRPIATRIINPDSGRYKATGQLACLNRQRRTVWGKTETKRHAAKLAFRFFCPRIRLVNFEEAVFDNAVLVAITAADDRGGDDLCVIGKRNLTVQLAERNGQRSCPKDIRLLGPCSARRHGCHRD